MDCSKPARPNLFSLFVYIVTLDLDIKSIIAQPLFFGTLERSLPVALLQKKQLTSFRSINTAEIVSVKLSHQAFSL